MIIYVGDAKCVMLRFKYSSMYIIESMFGFFLLFCQNTTLVRIRSPKLPLVILRHTDGYAFICTGFEISISEIAASTPMQQRWMEFFCLLCSKHWKKNYLEILLATCLSRNSLRGVHKTPVFSSSNKNRELWGLWIILKNTYSKRIVNFIAVSTMHIF